MLISDYLVRSLVDSVYSPGLLLASAPLPFGTTTLNLALLGKMSSHGFSGGQNCTLDVFVTGDTPEFFITEKDGLTLKANLALDLKCKKKAEDEDYS